MISEKNTAKTDIGYLKDCSAAIVEQIENILDLAGIKGLHKYGVKESDLDGILGFTVKAKAAFDFNPVDMTGDDIKSMLKTLM